MNTIIKTEALGFSYGSEEESGSRYDEMLAEQKNLIDLGKSVEVINGALSNHAGSNGLSVEETRRIM